MKLRSFTMCVVMLSLIFWLSDSFIHRFIYSEESFEIIPADANELWMRILVIILLIGIGVVADNLTARIDAAEREKYDIYVATVSSAQHVLNNLLNQLQLVFFETDKTHKLSDETRKLLEQSINEAKKQVDRLSSVEEPSEEIIRKSVQPN